MDNEISLWSLSDMLGMHKPEPQMWPKWNKVAGGAQGAEWTMAKRTGRATRAHCWRINQWRMDRLKEVGATEKKPESRRSGAGGQMWACERNWKWERKDSGSWTLDSGLSYATTPFRCLQWRVKTKDCGPGSTLLEKVTSPDLLYRQDILRI